MTPLPDLTDAEADERVRFGARWLDENAPADWRSRIDNERLELADGRLCICGQVFAECAAADPNGYIVAAKKAGAWDEQHHYVFNADTWAAPCGFVPRQQPVVEGSLEHLYRSEREWDALDAAWRRLLFPNSEAS